MSETRALLFCRVLGRNRAVRRWRPAERPQFCYSSLFSYVGATRPAFALKPQAAALKAHGAEIIVIDSQFSCMEQIQELLKGVDTGTGMSILNYNQLELQCPQIYASESKSAGMKRIYRMTLRCLTFAVSESSWSGESDERLFCISILYNLFFVI